VRSYVAGDPNAIGYISSAEVDNTVKAVSINGVAPTFDNIATGKYAVRRDYLFVTNGNPSGNAKAFIDFTLSPAGQALLKADGEVPITASSHAPASTTATSAAM
jgi:phosphate transport system substrate-binding protein